MGNNTQFKRNFRDTQKRSKCFKVIIEAMHIHRNCHKYLYTVCVVLHSISIVIKRHVQTRTLLRAS